MGMFKFKNYTLVIAEKPKAAYKISKALSKGKSLKLNHKGVPYWYVIYNGKPYVIVPSAGHLYTLATNKSSYPVFDYRWVPRWFEDKNAKHLIKFYELLSKLSKHAKSFINACDYDIEGSVIGYMIIKFLGDEKKAFRVKFSSLTEDELKKAFNNPHPLDWELIEAGLCRHELDWIWGINVSRALSDVFRRYFKKYLVLSAGRVQSPTLIEVYKKEVSVRTFIPIPSYTLIVYVNINGKEYKLENNFNAFETRQKAKRIANEIRRQKYLKVVDISVKRIVKQPPPPFNLSDLQYEAYKILGFNPYKTQKLAEDLYLETLISYPRTNSQKLPPTLNYLNILNKLKRSRYRTLIQELLKEVNGVLKPREGIKEDPAHPAIYPTGYLPSNKLSEDHLKLYDLIVRRFLATFSTSLTINQTLIKFKGPENLYFRLSGYKILHKGWLKYYPFIELKEEEVPLLNVNDVVKITQVRVLTTYSKPPQRFSKATLLKWMESVGIGTEATRAQIIETLFNRGYLENLKNNKIKITDLGLAVAEVLMKYFSELTSVDLTRKFEEFLSYIQFRKVRKEIVVNEAKKVLNEKLKKFKEVIDETVDYVKKFHVNDTNSRSEVKCSLCNRIATNNKSMMCFYHTLAFDKLRNTYDIWKHKERISWVAYLEKILKLKSIGIWVKEVANYLRRNKINIH